MDSIDHFKEDIKGFLDELSEQDESFAKKYWNPKKNIDDCCTYIINQVEATKRKGFSDQEIFGMAVHYFDEENIEIGSPKSCRVVSNRTIELTEEEKAQARQAAMKRAQDEAYAQLTKSKKKPAAKSGTPEVEQKSLF